MDVRRDDDNIQRVAENTWDACACITVTQLSRIMPFRCLATAKATHVRRSHDPKVWHEYY